jgi:hypothetical protein
MKKEGDRDGKKDRDGNKNGSDLARIERERDRERQSQTDKQNESWRLSAWGIGTTDQILSYTHYTPHFLQTGVAGCPAVKSIGPVTERLLVRFPKTTR